MGHTVGPGGQRISKGSPRSVVRSGRSSHNCIFANSRKAAPVGGTVKVSQYTSHSMSFYTLDNRDI